MLILFTAKSRDMYRDPSMPFGRFPCNLMIMGHLLSYRGCPISGCSALIPMCSSVNYSDFVH